MWEFIQEYFISPILANGWFNPVNTAAYSILLIIAVYFVFKLLRKMRIEIDERFAWAIVPFIFWAASTRVLHDAAFAGRLSPELNAFYSSPIFPTPGSYLITFALALATLLVSLLIQKATRVPYYYPMFLAGAALTAYNLALIPVVDLFPLWLIGGITLLWSGIFMTWEWIALGKSTSKDRHAYHPPFSGENLAILSAHFLDATATVVALSVFGYVEQHVVPRLFFPFLGPSAMFLLKAGVVLPALWAIDRYAEDPNFRKFLKIVVLILGLAPGLRDLIRLVAMV